MLTSTLSAFKIYKKAAKKNLIDPRRASYIKLKPDDKSLVDHFFSSHLDSLEEAIEDNSFILDCVADVAATNFGGDQVSDSAVWQGCSPMDVDKVQSTLKQMAREWSSDGQAERDQSYGRIIHELVSAFPDLVQRHSVRVLVPGCGLGRLPFDLAAQGFDAQGNEFSFHMLFTSSFILNHTQHRNEYRIHPYIHSFSNHRSRQNQLREVLIPDVAPPVLSQLRETDPTIPEDGLLSMTAGSFEEIYPPADGSLFQVVATVFFIDTAPNIFKTLTSIAGSLESGGLWINFGPLLWHYENTAPADNNGDDYDDDRVCGFELALDDLLQVIPKYGFEIVKHETAIPCRYTSCEPDSLGGFVYNCAFWVAKKL